MVAVALSAMFQFNDVASPCSQLEQQATPFYSYHKHMCTLPLVSCPFAPTLALAQALILALANGLALALPIALALAIALAQVPSPCPSPSPDHTP